MNLQAKVTGIDYKIILKKELEPINLQDFDINKMPANCIIKDKNTGFAISKWVSPKRTRSYPYERVYNTLSFAKKITVIPIVKDEGLRGDRDFIQWDTISLMSLLDVYVILAYYDDAEKHKTRENKITKQVFDNEYILEKIQEIQNYHSSALHWNLKEINESLEPLLEKVKTTYQTIENKLKVKLHNIQGIEDLQNKLKESAESFMKASRQKAEKAQQREFQTIQPKELLSSLTKAKITIRNYLGGEYFLTVDEILQVDGTIHLIEAKHSKNAPLPSLGDIKDGLMKMILYSNFAELNWNNTSYDFLPVLKLTSTKIKGKLSNRLQEEEINTFFEQNNLNKTQEDLLKDLLKESGENSFLVEVLGVKTVKKKSKQSVAKSPLRYPGGKSRAIKTIMPLIPDFEEYREPFLGGGSLFLHLKQQFPNRKFWVNDLYRELYLFWKYAQEQNIRLVNQVQAWKNEFQEGKVLHKFLKKNIDDFDELKTAAAFFVFNRITFSGTSEAGGFSNAAFEKRFTESSLDRLLQVEGVLEDAKISHLDYEELLKAKGKNVFLFLDPPYFSATKSALYGKNGKLHKDFDHERLAQNLKKCSHQWLMTYDDSAYIRNLYGFAYIQSWDLKYGMRNVNTNIDQTGKELFISNYDLQNNFAQINQSFSLFG